MKAGQSKTVKVGGKTLQFSRLEKEMYPNGFTKADVINYYSKISPQILPHLAGRMLTLKRYPDGSRGFFFYEKRCPSHKPDWIKTKTIASTHGNEDIPYCEIDGEPALLWAANLGALELHILLSTDRAPANPTSVVFDLDPGPEKNFRDCCRLGLQMRDLFITLNLKCFPKNSGKKGLHLYIPLNSKTDFDKTKNFAHQIARTLENKYPDKITSNMKKTERAKRIFIDWSQNDSHKTTVCVYSLRAADEPWVSTPLDWKEVETFSKGRRPWLHFTSDEVLRRVKKYGDLFGPVLTLKQKLPVI